MRKSIFAIAVLLLAFPAFAQFVPSSPAPVTNGGRITVDSVARISPLVHFTNHATTVLSDGRGVMEKAEELSIAVTATTVAVPKSGDLLFNAVVHRPLLSCSVTENGSAASTITVTDGNTVPIKVFAGISVKVVKVEMVCKVNLKSSQSQ